MQSEIEYQKAVALGLLDKLRVIDPDVFLAGGSVRDWYFDKPAKDLDIYINATDSIDHRQLKLVVEQLLNSTVEELGSEGTSEYASNPNLLRVVQTTYRGMRVQIMAVKNRRSIVKSFPLGICQCGMDWRGRFYYTKAFKQEVKFKALVLRNQAYKNGDKYIAKIKSYFPDYRYFDNVEVFLEYVTKDDI